MSVWLFGVGLEHIELNTIVIVIFSSEFYTMGNDQGEDWEEADELLCIHDHKLKVNLCCCGTRVMSITEISQLTE